MSSAGDQALQEQATTAATPLPRCVRTAGPDPEGPSGSSGRTRSWTSTTSTACDPPNTCSSRSLSPTTTASPKRCQLPSPLQLPCALRSLDSTGGQLPPPLPAQESARGEGVNGALCRFLRLDSPPVAVTAAGRQGEEARRHESRSRSRAGGTLHQGLQAGLSSLGAPAFPPFSSFPCFFILPLAAAYACAPLPRSHSRMVVSGKLAPAAFS